MSAANRQRKPVVLLRPVPGPSVIHDLWAGTKLIIVFAFGVLLTFYPGWAPIALVFAVVLLACRLARIPRGVLPSIPKFLWFLLFLGGLTAAFSGGSPEVAIGTVHIGLGGLLSFLRITALSIVLLGLGFLISWTTNVADVAPAVATLGRPLRLLRIPIDDWAVAVALTLRAFPMLLDEYRLMYAARKLRPRPVLPTRRDRRRFWRRDLIDLLGTAVVVTLRRGDEMGDAITARGGTGQIAAAPTGPKARDWVALSAVAVVCALALVLELKLPGG